VVLRERFGWRAQGRSARAGRYDSTGSRPPIPERPDDLTPAPCPTRAREEDPARVAIRPTPGRSLVTRHAVVDIVRTATLGSYGVTGFAADPFTRVLGFLGLAQPGLTVRIGHRLEVELDLDIALGVPVAEVARQVDSAVRYAIRRALGREIERFVIHVGGLRVQPAGSIPAVSGARPEAIRPHDLADSGTDVA
jgi:uncharacterized alkaline shock family protein YloU